MAVERADGPAQTELGGGGEVQTRAEREVVLGRMHLGAGGAAVAGVVKRVEHTLVLQGGLEVLGNIPADAGEHAVDAVLGVEAASRVPIAGRRQELAANVHAERRREVVADVEHRALDVSRVDVVADASPVAGGIEQRVNVLVASGERNTAGVELELAHQSVAVLVGHRNQSAVAHDGLAPRAGERQPLAEVEVDIATQNGNVGHRDGSEQEAIASGRDTRELHGAALDAEEAVHMGSHGDAAQLVKQESIVLDLPIRLAVPGHQAPRAGDRRVPAGVGVVRGPDGIELATERIHQDAAELGVQHKTIHGVGARSLERVGQFAIRLGAPEGQRADLERQAADAELRVLSNTRERRGDLELPDVGGVVPRGAVVQIAERRGRNDPDIATIEAGGVVGGELRIQLGAAGNVGLDAEREIVDDRRAVAQVGVAPAEAELMAVAIHVGPSGTVSANAYECTAIDRRHLGKGLLDGRDVPGHAVEPAVDAGDIVPAGGELGLELIHEPLESGQVLGSHARRTLRTGGTLRTLRALRAGRTLRTLRASGTLLGADGLEGALKSNDELVAGEYSLTSEVSVRIAPNDVLLAQLLHGVVRPVGAVCVNEHVRSPALGKDGD